MGATVVSESYTALLTSTLRNYMPKKAVDNLSVGRFLRFVMNGTKGRGKSNMGGYKIIDSLGERIQVPLLYGGSPTDTYSGWQTIDITPIDGMTSAFFPTRQMATSVVITGFEQEQNKGENQIIDLLQTKADQALISLKDFANEVILSGNGRNGNSLTNYVSAINASVGPDPISILVSKTPTTGAVGSIDPAVNTWWGNQFTQASATTYAGLETQLDTLYTNCAVAAGGDSEPDFHLLDPQTFNLYRALLRRYAKVEGFKDADLPFETVTFHGGVAFYDKWVPDNLTGTTPGLGGVSATRDKGTWFMFTSDFIQIYASKSNNFRPGKFVEAIDQDGIASKVLWYGGVVLNNRAKHGLYNNIDLTIVA